MILRLLPINCPSVVFPVCLSSLIDSLSVFPAPIDRPPVSCLSRLSVAPRATVCPSAPIDRLSVVFPVCLSPQTDYLPVSPDRPFVGCVDRLLVTLDRLSVRLPRSTVSQLSSSSICPFRPFVCQSSRLSVLVTVRLSSRSLL